MVNALVDQSVEAFKRKGKKVSREIIINSLIDDEENKRATGESSKPGFLKGMQGGFDTLKVLKQILRGAPINPFTGEPYS